MLHNLLPKPADNTFTGYRISLYFFIFMAFYGVLRSLIHMFFPQGGFIVIGGQELVGDNVAFAVGMIYLWGSAQLVYSFVQIAVGFHYRSLIPFFYLIMFLEYGLRLALRYIKPVDIEKVPGSYLTEFMVPLSLIMFVLAIAGSKRSEK